MVDVTHDSDHWRTRQHFVLRLDFCVFFEERIRIVELGGKGLVAHLFHQNHRGFLVELLVDGDHLTQLHQLLDDLGRLDRHLVCQIGHADGFGHVHFLHLRFHRCHKIRRRPVVPITAATRTWRTPARASCTCRWASRRLAECALLGVLGPAGRQLLGLDRFLVARLGNYSGGRTRCARRHGLLVDRAFDFDGDRLRLFRLLRDQHTLGRRHHRANRGGFVFCCLAAFGQVGSSLLLLVNDVSRLDDAQHRLDRLGRHSHDRNHCNHGFNLDIGLRARLCFDQSSLSCSGGSNRSGLRFKSSLLHSGFASLGFCYFTIARFLLFTQAALFSHIFFLTTQQVGLRFGFFFTAHEFSVITLRCSRLVRCR